ncbi:hypothetical protein [Sphingorhabdus sp.]|jgi:hypothetical protein|uniref:hypothetical protein n=1 Tax=Sphingorhabdus sp. TaxID=1902408 RepID=UPI0037C94128
MSNGPVSGNGIACTLPQGKTALWTATAQATNNQFVQLRDSRGNIIFTATGASVDGHSPTPIGNGSFVAGDPSNNYMLYIGTNGGASWSQVIWDDLPLTYSGTTKISSYNFISEDSSDQDFNDLWLSLTWFDHVG